MEGITGYTFRNVHHHCYPGMDRYFTPFISPNQHHAVNPKEHRDVVQSNNSEVPIVPQVLTNKSELFLWAARELKEKYGYTEVNLNLGCPSKTVVSKQKGSGFLGDTEKLNRFFDGFVIIIAQTRIKSIPENKKSSHGGYLITDKLGEGF